MSDNQSQNISDNEMFDILRRIYESAYGSTFQAGPELQRPNIDNIISSFNQAINNTFMSFSQLSPEIYNMINASTQESQEMHLIPQYKTYPESDYSIGYIYFSSISSANPTEQVLSYILDIYYSTGNFPTNEQLVEYAIENSCICIENIPQIANVYTYYIFTLGFIPACNQLIDILEHHTFHREYPSEEQIEEIRRLRTLEETDRERLHAENKVIVACKNLENLKPQECNISEQNCGICLNELKNGDHVYKLPQCNHMLQTNNKCPLCKTVVELQPSDN